MVWNGAAWIVDAGADTGWLLANSRLANGWAPGPGAFYVRRTGSMVGHVFDLAPPATWSGTAAPVVPPGFTPYKLALGSIFLESGNPRSSSSIGFVNSQTVWCRVFGPAITTGRVMGELWTTTTDPWPTVLPYVEREPRT
jgi:hypothetical protein